MRQRKTIDRAVLSRKRWIVLLLLAHLLLNTSGCMKYHGLRPIYPTVGNPGVPNTVTSLQPVLEWAPFEGKEGTYDVVVVEQLNDAQNHKVFNPGRTVFFREGITDTKVKIEPPLEFDKIYWWTVRTRNGDAASEWSRYDYSGSYFYVHVYAKNFPYPFRTPVNEHGLDEAPPSP